MWESTYTHNNVLRPDVAGALQVRQQLLLQTPCSFASFLLAGQCYSFAAFNGLRKAVNLIKTTICVEFVGSSGLIEHNSVDLLHYTLTLYIVLTF